MRLSKPRIAPVPREQWTEEQREIMAPMLEGKGVSEQAVSIFTTLLNHPKLMRRWMVFANHVMLKSTLPARDRELAILRIGWLCRSGYEFGQHVVIGRDCGISDEEISRLEDGPQAPGWSARDRCILRATDELHEDAFVSDTTYCELAGFYSTEQIMDLVFTVGQYNLVSMALNTFGVQPDPGIEELWPLPPENGKSPA